MRAVDVILVRCVAPVKAVLGEGPLWDPRIKKLLFTDIKGGALFIFDPRTQKTERRKADEMLSAMGLAAGGGYVCARRDGFARMQLGDRGIRIEPVCNPEPEEKTNRFNDGKTDPFGGFWSGTMDDAEKRASGAWWRLAPSGECQRLDENYRVTNGPAFDKSRGRAYFTDSARRIIYKANFDGAKIHGKDVFLKFDGDEGYPDGMEIDRHGCLWVAFWDGAAIRRFSPDGAFIQKIEIGVPRPTSLAFCGARIFVTSARTGLSDDLLSEFPDSGGLFEIQLAEDIAPDETWYFGENTKIVD